MIDVSLGNLAAYCAQILIVVSLAAVAARVFDVPHASWRLAYWRALVIVCLALPLVSLAQPLVPAMSAFKVASLRTPVITPPDELLRVTRDELIPAGTADLSLTWYVTTVLVAGIGGRGIWLLVGLARLRRLRRTSTPLRLDAVAESLRADIAPHADIRLHTRTCQPSTFGLRRPVILLPCRVDKAPRAERHAIICHELVHVRRRDWAWLIGEEILRTMFWFHPAMRYAISRVQASREEVVDAEVVARTGSRLNYMRALVSFADESGLVAAPSFVRRHQLRARLSRLSEEVQMSRMRLRVAASALVAGLVAAVAVAGAGVHYELAAQQPTDMAPPEAVQFSFSVPIARAIVRLDRPVYPPEAWRAGIGAVVSFWVRIAPDGRVTMGPPNWQVRVSDTSPLEAVRAFQSRDGWQDFLTSVREAVERWQYVPADGDAVVRVEVTFDTPPRRRLSTGIEPGPTSPLPPVRAGDGAVPAPRRISFVNAEYNPYALAARAEGVVALEALIGVDGLVHDIRVTDSIPLLDGSAVDAVARWRFEPTVVDGVPRDALISVLVNFSLR